MGVPLLNGRLFDAADTASSRQVVLVSRSAARQFWPGPIRSDRECDFDSPGRTYDAEVVGVVGDVRHEALDRPAAPEVFLPYAQSGFYALTLRGSHGVGIAGDAATAQGADLGDRSSCSRSSIPPRSTS